MGASCYCCERAMKFKTPLLSLVAASFLTLSCGPFMEPEMPSALRKDLADEAGKGSVGEGSCVPEIQMREIAPHLKRSLQEFQHHTVQIVNLRRVHFGPSQVVMTYIERHLLKDEETGAIRPHDVPKVALSNFDGESCAHQQTVLKRSEQITLHLNSI